MNAASCVIVFESVHHAIRAEKILLGKGMALEMIPTPRELSMSCGQSIEVSMPDGVLAEKILRESGAQYKAIYWRDKGRRGFEQTTQRDFDTGE